MRSSKTDLLRAAQASDTYYGGTLQHRVHQFFELAKKEALYLEDPTTTKEDKEFISHASII